MSYRKKKKFVQTRPVDTTEVLPRINTITVDDRVQEALDKICEREYRSAGDQIRYMIDKLYGAQPAPKKPYKFVRKSDLGEDTDAAVFLRAAYTIASHITTKAVHQKLLSNKKSKYAFTEKQVSSGLSNLKYFGYLASTGGMRNRRYTITDAGEKLLRKWGQF